MMKISKLLKQKQTFSFEFFPPKKEEQEPVLFKTIDNLAAFRPDFVSITYGAGGSTSKKTFVWTKQITEQYRINSMMHFTCYGNTSASVENTCEQMINAGIDNILVLRGDRPVGFEDPVLEFKYANELVSFIRKRNYDVCIGVAGYPEKHGEAKSMQEDIDNLKRKLDAGGDFIVTQLFFDNSHFYRYRELLVKNQINAPVIAGIMPVSSLSQVKRFEEMCSIVVPDKVVDRLSLLNSQDCIKYGEEYAFTQSLDLLENNVAGVHFYTLNKHDTTEKIMNQLVQEGFACQQS